MTDNRTTELLPCPFCGGEAELWHNKTWDYVVRCTNKGCAARTRQYHENSNGAVDAWNTRTPEQAIAATLGSNTKECENLFWELVGALDVAYATDASEKPIIREYARRIAATLGEEKAGRKSPPEGGPGPCGQPSDDIVHEAETLGSVTLGSEPPYDELLRCLENDWHISASWDGLRKFWCVELTEDGVKLRDATHGTLTAEQVREAIERNFGKVAVLDDGKPVEWRDDWVCKVGIDYKGIADELNARAERTCEVESKIFIEGEYVPCPYYEYEMACGGQFRWDEDEPPRHCPSCGKAVKL